ncbi:hypothetical protein CHARACLAT_018172 [Characodon lateralis]|uniref:Uncharacterized protein n=1 Tax=Characodon lateralis TaxID=208331 RepID=A0ABU7D2Q9_9TELE|nr:hypothetical protein [Characodon lateralis]
MELAVSYFVSDSYLQVKVTRFTSTVKLRTVSKAMCWIPSQDETDSAWKLTCLRRCCFRRHCRGTRRRKRTDSPNSRRCLSASILELTVDVAFIVFTEQIQKCTNGKKSIRNLPNRAK